MSLLEETIDATLDQNGQLLLTHQPQLPPGPVRVTIRVAAAGPKRGMADVIQEIAADQRSRGFTGRSAAELKAEDDANSAEDAERDRELDAAARRPRLRGIGALLLGHDDRHLCNSRNALPPGSEHRIIWRQQNRLGINLRLAVRPGPNVRSCIRSGQRAATVGLFSVLSRAESPSLNPDRRDARPRRGNSRRPHLPLGRTRCTPSIRFGRRSPSRCCDRVRL